MPSVVSGEGGASWRCGCGAGVGCHRSSRRANRWGEDVQLKVTSATKTPREENPLREDQTSVARHPGVALARRRQRHHSPSQTDARLSERHLGDGDPDTPPTEAAPSSQRDRRRKRRDGPPHEFSVMLLPQARDTVPAVPAGTGRCPGWDRLGPAGAAERETVSRDSAILPGHCPGP